MIDASVYKIIHLLGIMLIFLSLGGVIMHQINGGGENTWRKQAGISHGVGLFLILLAGFGMLARLNISFTSGWVLAKLVIWVLLGGTYALALRKKEFSRRLWLGAALLGVLAASLAITKPF